MSAKEMFKKLGYKEDLLPCNYYKDYKNRRIFIRFLLKKKKVVKGKCGYAIEPMELEDIEISMKELQAINKQIEELGWK